MQTTSAGLLITTTSGGELDFIASYKDGNAWWVNVVEAEWCGAPVGAARSS